MDIGKIRSYLTRLNAGTLSKEEEAWILHFLENASEEELLQVFPEEEWQDQQPAILSEKQLNNAYSEVQSVINKVIPIRIAWWKKPVARITAAAAVLGMGIAVWSVIKPDFRRHTTLADAEWKMIATKAGENLVMYLPDNSRIYINGATKVMYPEKFAGPIREVKLLEGEIFLDVAPNAIAPFKVATEKVDIKVLGTSFNVRNYKEEQLTEVAVKTGKISVTSSGSMDSVLLTPGKRIVISEVSGNALLTDTELRTVDGWTQNEFAFDNVQLKDVFRKLEYKYGLKFEVHNTKILNKHIKATFRDKSRKEIVDLLSKMLHFNYQMKDSLVVIK